MRARQAAAIRRYTAARRALDENSLAEYAAGVTGETPDFLAANREAHEAGRALSAWRRRRIAARVARELDYWSRMRQIRRQS